MDWRSALAIEEERRAPVRVRGTEDGGGATGPSTVKGERDLVPKKWKTKCVSLPPDAGPGDVPKGTSPGLGGGADPFFCVILCWAKR